MLSRLLENIFLVFVGALALIALALITVLSVVVAITGLIYAYVRKPIIVLRAKWRLRVFLLEYRFAFEPSKQPQSGSQPEAI